MLKVHAQFDESWLTAEVEQIYRVACRLTGNVHDAEDLVQDVCERALRKGPLVASSDDLRRWLLRVLYNRFVDGTRHRQRSPLVATGAQSDAAEMKLEAPDSESLAVQSEQESSLMRAWNLLEQEQQMLLLLRAEGYDLDEIAAVLEIDKPALSSRLHRARSSLAKYLDQERPAPPLRVIAEKRR